jgi:Ser-tRNA(Ala) deacylase AlaX
MTQQLNTAEAYLRDFDATVVESRDGSVVLDRTAFCTASVGLPNTSEIGRIRIASKHDQGSTDNRLVVPE